MRRIPRRRPLKKVSRAERYAHWVKTNEDKPLKKVSYKGLIHYGWSSNSKPYYNKYTKKFEKAYKDVDLACREWPWGKGWQWNYVDNDQEVTCRICQKSMNIARNS